MLTPNELCYSDGHVARAVEGRKLGLFQAARSGNPFNRVALYASGLRSYSQMSSTPALIMGKVLVSGDIVSISHEDVTVCFHPSRKGLYVNRGTERADGSGTRYVWTLYLCPDLNPEYPTDPYFDIQPMDFQPDDSLFYTLDYMNRHLNKLNQLLMRITATSFVSILGELEIVEAGAYVDASVIELFQLEQRLADRWADVGYYWED